MLSLYYAKSSTIGNSLRESTDMSSGNGSNGNKKNKKKRRKQSKTFFFHYIKGPSPWNYFLQAMFFLILLCFVRVIFFGMGFGIYDLAKESSSDLLVLAHSVESNYVFFGNMYSNYLLKVHPDPILEEYIAKSS